MTSTTTSVPHDNSTTISMNEEELHKYLQKLQDEEFKGYIPALVFLVIIAATGCIGNVLVVFVYKTKYHRTPTRTFIIAMACFDLMTNFVCLPGEIYDFYHQWEFSSAFLCKLDRFSNASTTIMSGFTLFALAVTRYRKVCRPFEWQITYRQAKYISVGIAIFGAVSSIPFAVIKGIHTRATPTPGVYGKNCSDSEAYSDTLWPMIINTLYLLFFLSLCVPLVVIYCLIGVKAYMHRKRHGLNNMQAKASDVPKMSHSVTFTDEVLEKTTEFIPLRWLQPGKNHTTTDTRSDLSADCLPDIDTVFRHEDSDASNHDNELVKDEYGGCRVKVFPLSAGGSITVHVSMVDEADTINLKHVQNVDNGHRAGFLEADDIHESKRKAALCTVGETAQDTASDTSQQEPYQKKTTNPEPTHASWPLLSIEKCNLQIPFKKRGLSKNIIFQKRHPPETKPDSPDEINNKTANNEHIDSSKNLQIAHYDNRRSACSVTGSHGFMLNSAGQQDERQIGASQSNTSITSMHDFSSTPSLEGKNTPCGKFLSCLPWKKAGGNRNKSSRSVINRSTKMVFLTTVMFILGYLPYPILIFYRFLASYQYKAMGLTEKAFFNLFVHLHFINSAANSVVYGLCDPLFRKELRKLFQALRCKTREGSSNH